LCLNYTIVTLRFKDNIKSTPKPSSPRQNQLGGEPLPTTGTKQGALPVTGEQAACIAYAE
ncbi:MAG: hypothetical protein ACTH4H_05925, partial [Pseudolactococcus laudensis]